MTVLLCLLSLCSGCATHGYFSNRFQDGADMLSVSLGAGVGVKGRVGPLQVGLLGDLPLVGLRGGEIVKNGIIFTETEYAKNEFLGGWEFDMQLLFFGGEIFESCGPYRGKRFVAVVDPFTPGTDDPVSRVPFLSKVLPFSHPYNYQIEAVIGLGPSIRLGCNFAEMLDFLLGWFGFDLLHDDIHGKQVHREQDFDE